MPTPLIERLPLDCQATALLPALVQRQAPIALLSGQTGAGWDILCADPDRLLGEDAQGLFVVQEGQRQALAPAADTLAILERWHAERRCPPTALPFAGGLAGYWAYEWQLGRRGLVPAAQGPALPTLWVGDYPWALLREQASGHWWLATDTPARAVAIKAWLQQAPDSRPGPFVLQAPFSTQTTPAAYRQAFARIQAYLQDGDCYQVNLARHYQAPYRGDPLAAFLHLQAAHTAPYGAYIGLPGQQAVLSLSPEAFLEHRADGHVRTRPIKGTRPRQADAAADRAAAQALQASSKDRAENLMIVDLLRNDLGQCCLPGSVRVSELFRLESHPNVHHLVSTVEGQCRPDIGPLALLAACFPGGSITGAPKQRAMEIIAELETVRRSVYCGAIGAISRDGQMRTSIAIRTLVADGGQLHCWGGGGIVADSDCEGEYRECDDKVAAFMRALENLRA